MPKLKKKIKRVLQARRLEHQSLKAWSFFVFVVICWWKMNAFDRKIGDFTDEPENKDDLVVTSICHQSNMTFAHIR